MENKERWDHQDIEYFVNWVYYYKVSTCVLYPRAESDNNI